MYLQCLSVLCLCFEGELSQNKPVRKALYVHDLNCALDGGGSSGCE